MARPSRLAGTTTLWEQIMTAKAGARRSGRGTRVVSLASAIALVLASAACGTGGEAANANGFRPPAQTGGTLTVWVDSTRLAAAKLYQKKHPSVPMKIVTYDGDANGSNYLQTKIGLFNRTREGWPDVVFSSQNNEVTWALDAGFTAPLNKGLMPKSLLEGWAPGANDPCTVDGTVYCLRNDLSQTVLWYDAPLLKRWGYQVPATWEQYEALGRKVAEEHPGYLVGSAGDTFTPEIYLWAGKCGANQVTGPRAVTVRATGPNCTRMAALLDTLIENHTLSTSSVFSSDFGKNLAGRILMMPGPAWFGGALFQGTFKVPAGQVAVAPMPRWSDDREPAVGNVGGGTWLLSAHSTNLKAGTDFLTWVTTSDDYQGREAPGYPAYEAAAKTWLADQTDSGYYVGDIATPLREAAGRVWPGWGYGQFSQETIWAATVIPGMTAGTSIESQLPAWQDAIVDHARADGYEVTR